MAEAPLVLHAATAARLAALARGAYPHEACALLLAEAGSTVLSGCVPLPNEAAAPRRAYRVGALALRDAVAAAEAAGRSVLGFFHSHPDGVAAPSAEDIETCPPWLGWAQLIGALAARGPLSLAAWQVHEAGWQSRPLALCGTAQRS
jgi:desampylase